jgi:hypothetical protein
MTTSKTRAKFEAWGTEYFNYGFQPDTWELGCDPGEYNHEGTQMAWEGYQAARRATLEEAARTLKEQLSLGYDAPENQSYRTGIRFSIRTIRALAAEEPKP